MKNLIWAINIVSCVCWIACIVFAIITVLDAQIDKSIMYLAGMAISLYVFLITTEIMGGE